MDMVQVDANTQEAILANTMNPNEIRSIFASYLAKERAKKVKISSKPTGTPGTFFQSTAKFRMDAYSLTVQPVIAPSTSKLHVMTPAMQVLNRLLPPASSRK